ncbi:MAG TPA: hypothetical protein VNI52_00610 [Sphingobacteriaceae bacterium]|nr:hypothetical protein [Sphingobacteriaceae bacterium]
MNSINIYSKYGRLLALQRGGSFLCSDQYCIRYRPGSRGKGEVNRSG